LSGNRRGPEAVPQVALPWIVRLRYAMAAGQITTVLFVRYALKIDLPLESIAVGPALVAASNLLLAARVARPDAPRKVGSTTLVAWAFVLDTLCLTGVLTLTGGPTNPFSLLYLVQITLSATILTKPWTRLLGALSSLCFGLLFWKYRPIPLLEMHHPADATNLHLIGMWISFSVAAFLIAMFSGKISELLRQREDSLLRMEGELAKKDRLASLVTLAAGAAHELNTPLGTIAVVAKELERVATNALNNSSIAEDTRLIRAEVDRCREILWRMSVQGAEPAAEVPERVDAGELLAQICRDSQQASRLKIDLEDPPALQVFTIPRRSVQQALIPLVKNALEASARDSLVRISALQVGEVLRFVVVDRGAGMSPEVLRRIGEPFFTTKEPGKGMGLGVFLVRTLAEQLGGSLTFESSVDGGTSAILELPVAMERVRASQS
jgi:two-component system sensor histidine kinase RegB